MVIPASRVVGALDLFVKKMRLSDSSSAQA
jgi:hypothetical protein